MEWVVIAIASTIAVVLAFLAGRKKGKAEAQEEIDTFASENRRLTQENSELSAQVALYGPKKKSSGVSASTKIKDALDSISTPSFRSSKASRPKPSPSRSSSSKSSGYKSSSRSSDNGSGIFGGIMGAAIFSSGDSGSGGGYSGGGDSGGGSFGGGSCD